MNLTYYTISFPASFLGISSITFISKCRGHQIWFFLPTPLLPPSHIAHQSSKRSSSHPYLRKHILSDIFPLIICSHSSNPEFASGTVQETSHAPHYVVTAILIPISQITGTHKTIEFITQRQVFPTTGISHRHIFTSITHLTFGIGPLYTISLTIYQRQLRIRSARPILPTSQWRRFRRLNKPLSSPLRLSISDPAFPVVTTIFGKLQIQLTRHFTTT